jgi:SAM-dependent methyltransferase
MIERRHPTSVWVPLSSPTSEEESWTWCASRRERACWTWRAALELSYSPRSNGRVQVGSSWAWIVPAQWWTALAARFTHRGISNAFVARMDVIALAFPERMFDTVLCGFALAGLPTPALRECSRVLRAQGRIGLTVSEGWWWEGDARWQWHSALLEALGIRVDLESRRFSTTQHLAAVLADHGFEGMSVAMESYDLVFADVSEWWSWAWSLGYRQILERMSSSQLERYRVACFEHLQHRPVQGRLQVFLAVGTKSSQ